MSNEQNEQVDEKLVTPKSSWIWLKDHDGTPSVSITFATVTFWVVIASYVLGMIDHIGGVHFTAFNVAGASSILIPTLSAYFGRRWVTTHYDSKDGDQQ